MGHEIDELVHELPFVQGMDGDVDEEIHMVLALFRTAQQLHAAHQQQIVDGADQACSLATSIYCAGVTMRPSAVQMREKAS
jgi:hypothetical protein